MGVLLGQRWDGWHHGWDGGWMWLWGSLMMVTWAAVIGVTVWLIIRATRPSAPPGPPGSTDRAREILDERFARGEIDAEEYRERRRELEQRP